MVLPGDLERQASLSMTCPPCLLVSLSPCLLTGAQNDRRSSTGRLYDSAHDAGLLQAVGTGGQRTVTLPTSGDVGLLEDGIDDMVSQFCGWYAAEQGRKLVGDLKGRALAGAFDIFMGAADHCAGKHTPL